MQHIHQLGKKKCKKKIFLYFNGFSLSMTSCFLAASIVQDPVVQTCWMALSIGLITIQQISIKENNCVIQWTDFYPVDSAIQRLNNWV